VSSSRSGFCCVVSPSCERPVSLLVQAFGSLDGEGKSTSKSKFDEEEAKGSSTAFDSLRNERLAVLPLA